MIHVMKIRLLPIHFTLLSVAFASHGQGSFLYDQQSATSQNVGGGGAPIQEDQPMGQSFTPTLTSVGFVQFEFLDFHLANGTGATVYVNLRAGSINGTILGSTAPVYMPDGFRSTPTNFFFSLPVAVTPGTTYYLQPVALPGSDDQYDVITSRLYNYTGGGAFYFGVPSPFADDDFWFREGILAPEPSSTALFLLPGGVFIYFRRISPKNSSVA